MTPDQFQTLLEQRFHGSTHYMAVWAKKLLRAAQARPKLVRKHKARLARAALAYLDSKGLA